MDAFKQLVDDIRQVLGPSSGLNSEDVEVEDLTHLMERYVSNAEGWTPYALSNDNMPYTRNLVDEGNGKANLLVLVWTPGKSSPIHDHGNAHCLMKILHGNLTETRYDFPDGDKEKTMEIKSERVHKENAVAYMADELGLHRMSNHGSDYAVSLHLYTPPNVARQGCNIFNPQTGKKTHVAKCGNYSVYGQRVKE
ncbi:RmlC-like cupin domain-containing protein [Hypoxylon argillaceum]|nr:RmlC-like cupin domain-containing protein [Hypoxylon argillaceum]KAI1146147.1 RmlC-like cupin domain-containing protein [Nemania diffusa]